MTDKWTIKKLNCHNGSPLVAPWHAIPPHTPIPPRNLPPDAMIDLYADKNSQPARTHAQALEYINETIREAADG